ncbi:MAG: UvrD-helicase domain-containing protein [Polyangiaceae bacterium]|nr:UvrD-helicase domain-containing protein [Polyangiaceae bacterium]
MSAESLSEVDEIALSFQRNVVVAASAGTGKTHRLTALYVLLTLGLTSMGLGSRRRSAAPVAPDRIWATTFTRAAAREIAQRVEGALGAIAKAPSLEGVPFAREIAARSAMLDDPPTSAMIKRRAAEALARWPAARIDTLHGLAGSIVDRHGLALGLPPGMRVLDEDESAHLAALAIDDVLSRALAAGGDAAASARYLLMATGGIHTLRPQLTRLFDRLDEEGVTPTSLALADHAEAARAVRAELARIARAASDGSGVPAVRTAASALLGALASAPGSADAFPEAAIDPTIEMLSVTLRKKREADEELDAFRKSFSGGTLRVAAERLVAFLRNAESLGARERGMVALIDEARSAALARRRRAGALGFGDLLRAARDGLRDQPELADLVCSDVDVLLVDEFQDTSTVQRDLVYLLRERVDARARRRPGDVPPALDLERHGLFLVGDRKQSIYGFRGADVAVFSRICAELGGEAAAFALHLPTRGVSRDANADFVALAESRRSGADVLAFVNAFSECDFSDGRAPSTARDFEVEYSAAERLVPVRPPEERGEVVVIEDDGAVPDDVDALTREAEGPLRESLVAAAWIAAHCAKTGCKPRDIAVLARRRNTLPLLSVALDRLGVPYVVAGRALYDAPEVRDLAALARLVVDPRDRQALATVLRGPVVSLSDTALAALSEPGKGIVYIATMPSLPERAALLTPDEQRRIAAFRAAFGAHRRAALRAPPADALRTLLTGFDLDRVFAALPRAEARLANVDRLVEIAAERGGTLASFSRWLDRRIADETDEPEGVIFSDDDDAVRLLTIHGSKGLDFPTVVLVDLAAEPRPVYPGVDLVPPQGDRPPHLLIRHFGTLDAAQTDEPAQVINLPTPAMKAAQTEARSREQAERRRLTYVALTRARDRLVLVSPATPPRGASAWRTLRVALPPEARATINRIESAVECLRGAAYAAAPRKHSTLEPAPRPKEAPRADASRKLPIAQTIALPTTALSLFEGCARRYRLRYLLGYDEPLASSQLDLFTVPEENTDAHVDDPLDDEDARDLGRAAHRVLERIPLRRWGLPIEPSEIEGRLVTEGVPRKSPELERLSQGIARFLQGRYVNDAKTLGAAWLREEPFVLDVPGGVRLALRGAMDLVLRLPDRKIDVVDYKRSRPRSDLSVYAFQLRAYALALARRFPEHAVRAGVLFLGAADEPAWIEGSAGVYFSAEDHQRFEVYLSSLAEAYSKARAAEVWEEVPLERCRSLHCGFVTACHRRSKKG